MNEYTRREEVRWTFIAAAALVVALAAAIGLLLAAKGPLGPDPAARQASALAETHAAQAHACVVAADKLVTEVSLFKAAAKTARLKTESPDAGAPTHALPGQKPEKAPDVELAWPVAVPSYKQAKLLAPCRAGVVAALGARPDDAAAWDVVAAAAAVDAPGELDKSAQLAAARKILTDLQDAPVDKLAVATKEADAKAKAFADGEHKRAETAEIRGPLPKGALPRELAVATGVALCLAALLLSFASVHAAAGRRAAALIPLREMGTPLHRGRQAAAILKLGAQHNGGEPGLVIGGALGGLVAGLLKSTDADVFAGGVMAGLLLGLGAQWAFRLTAGLASWRARAIELGDVEKPTLPIVLVLSGVNTGLEADFMKFFDGLSADDAAATVEKLAAQAEEKILAAAEVGATAPAYGGMPQPAPHGGMPPRGAPPGGVRGRQG